MLSHLGHSSFDRPQHSLKLILKVGGNNSTPEHGNDSPATVSDFNPGVGLFGSLMNDYSERHKKSKKKKKKKDREKKHKHHKEKRRHREDSSQEDFSLGEDSSQLPHENMMIYSSLTTTNSLASTPVTKPLIPMISPPFQQQLPSYMDDSVLSPLQHLQTSHQMRIEDQSLLSPDSFVAHKQMENPKTPSSGDSNGSGREPRTCVLKLKQSRSPLAKLLDHLLKALEKRDPHQFFAWPVTDDIAPGYSAIISKPMDFSTMRQKIDDNEYTTLNEFSDDFKLMCENAIKYNHPETVYHKASKRLLQLGARFLQPENLVRHLRPLMAFMRELSSKELGFELPLCHLDNQENELHNADSADEAVAAAVDEGINSQIEEEENRKQIRLENNPKTNFEPFVDDLTSDEILQQVQKAAKMAKNRVMNKRHANKIGFLRQHKNGTTSMKILLDVENEGPEKLISLGAFTGKLQSGTGQLQAFREDRRNTARIVKPLNYGAFSSFAPIFDSRFSNLNKDETELVLNTYGDDTGSKYAESIMEFSKDSPYASVLANGLLDLLTNGEHRKTMAEMMETQRQHFELNEVEKSIQDQNDINNDIKKFEKVKIDFNNLKSLSELGVNVDFIDKIENNLKMIEIQTKLQEQLNSNSTLLEQLQEAQQERLSSSLPSHLSHIQHPKQNEIQLANQITTNLTEITKQLPPMAITSSLALRKAMGVAPIGLEPFNPQEINILSAHHQLQQQQQQLIRMTETTPTGENNGAFPYNL